MKKEIKQFNAVFRPEPEGGFTVLVPSLPGCVTYGSTLTEAKKMAREAVDGYLESLHERGELVPSN